MRFSSARVTVQWLALLLPLSVACGGAVTPATLGDAGGDAGPGFDVAQRPDTMSCGPTFAVCCGVVDGCEMEVGAPVCSAEGWTCPNGGTASAGCAGVCVSADGGEPGIDATAFDGGDDATTFDGGDDATTFDGGDATTDGSPKDGAKDVIGFDASENDGGKDANVNDAGTDSGPVDAAVFDPAAGDMGSMCAPPSGGPMCTPGVIECGNTTCGVPMSECCELPGNADTCIAAGGGCQGSVLSCNEAADCSNGQACCIAANDTTTLTASCQTLAFGACPTAMIGHAQICRSANECPSGTCNFWSCMGTVVEACTNPVPAFPTLCAKM
jgi:hypothetical protein